MAKTNTLTLLLTGGAPEDAETLVSALRNTGLSLKAACARDAGALERALATPGETDLVLIMADSETLATDEALGLLRERSADLPVLILTTETPDPERTAIFMHQGARDAVSRACPAHLGAVLAREVGELRRRRRSQEAVERLAEVEGRFRIVADHTREAVGFVADGVHVYANPAYAERFGFPGAEALLGTPLLDLIDTKDQNGLRQQLRDLTREASATGSIEVRCRGAGDHLFDATLELHAARYDGEPAAEVIVRGPDTPPAGRRWRDHGGVQTRIELLDALDAALALDARIEGVAALLHIGIDGHENILANHGIRGADALFAEIVQVIRSHAGERDHVATVGEATLGVFTCRPDAHHVTALAETLCEAIAQHRFDAAATGTPFVTASIGVSTARPGQDDAQALWNDSAQALRHAAGAGGNRVQNRDDSALPPNTDSALPADADAVAALRTALSAGRFRLAFQPVVSLRGGSEEHFRVLLRMLDGDGGEKLPAAFLDTAVAGGLMPELDRHVFAESFASAVRERTAGRHPVLAIKLSGSSLTGEATADWVRGLRAESGADAAWFTVLVDAPLAMTHLVRVEPLFETLRAEGFRVAIDDVDGSPRELALLRRLRPHDIWIHPAITATLAGEPRAQEALREIVDTSRAIGARSVAKSVESANVMSLLWGAGVDLIHGYFVQAPSAGMVYEFATG